MTGAAVRILRIVLRAPPAVLLTAFAAVIPILTFAVSLGSKRVVTRVGSGTCRVWARLLCAILGIRIHVRGSVPRNGSFVVVANHLSYVDIWVLGSLYSSLFVAKREIGSWPLFGWAARWAGTLFVDRDRPRDVVRVGRQMVEHLEAGYPLTLFPEGWASRGESVRRFMPSLLEPAARCGVPCHAVALRYETPGEPLPPSVTICWYDRVDFVPHLARLMGLRRIEATVMFVGEPMRSSDRKVLADGLYRKVAGAFVPLRQAAAPPVSSEP